MNMSWLEKILSNGCLLKKSILEKFWPVLSPVKYSLLLRKYRLDLIFDSKEYMYDMSKLIQSNNANLILLNFC